MSLRFRLALSIAAISLLANVLIGVAVYRYADQDRDRTARKAIVGRIRNAVAIYQQSGQAPFGASAFTASVPPPLAVAVRRGEIATYEPPSGQALWAGAPADAPGGGLFLRAQRSSDESALGDLRDRLILVGGLGTTGLALAAIAAAWGISRRLRRAARIADRVAAGDLDARIAPRGGDEIASLGRAVDGMAGSLQDRIERERRFSADVAHELRTPVTGLLMAAGLLDDSRPAQIVRERTGALAALVEQLLEIARLEAGQEASQSERVEMSAFVREACGRAGRPLEVTAETPWWSDTDRRRVERILVNLIENAFAHGKEPVSVTATPGRIAVADAGAGFPARILERGPERFSIGDPARGHGSGLGLSIAAAQAALVGGELAFRNTPGGGEAELTLPVADVHAPANPYARSR